MCNTLLGCPTVWLVMIIYVTFSSEEWVEIHQSGANKNYQFSTQSSQSDLLSSILDSDYLTPLDSNSKPSKAWLDYQKERFGLITRPTESTKVIKRVNQLTITDRETNTSDRAITNFKTHIPFVVYDTIGGISDEETDRTTPKPGVNRNKNFKIRNKIEITINQDDYDHVENDSRSNEDHEATAAKKTGVSEKTKLSSFQRFLEYVKSIQNTLITKTSHGIKDKIDYLHKFKDHLLFEIEDRINALWPSPEKTPKDSSKRSKRGVLEQESFVSFPSAETALMTINFLTFAVFLIKLVLQVINTIKSKHYSYNGLQVNTMEAIKVGKKRRTRSDTNSNRTGGNIVDDFNTQNILNSIDNFQEKLKFI